MCRAVQADEVGPKLVSDEEIKQYVRNTGQKVYTCGGEAMRRWVATCGLGRYMRHMRRKIPLSLSRSLTLSLSLSLLSLPDFEFLRFN